MAKCLLYMAPIVLIGLVAAEAPAAMAARSGSIGQNIIATAPEGRGVPLVLECQRGGGEAAAVLAAAAVAPVAVPVFAAAALAAVPGPVPAEETSVAPVRTEATSAAPVRTAATSVAPT
jgi:hypothetical protein